MPSDTATAPRSTVHAQALTLRAVDFFSGIGSFAEAVRQTQAPLRTVAAFDQDRDAQRVYRRNFGLDPSTRTLDSIPLDQIPPADLWWLSPPCQPFTRRGRQRDVDDPRAASLLRLTNLIAVVRPPWILIENVLGFAQSRARQLLLARLNECSYQTRELTLCSTQFGIPMQRPRWFLVAGRKPLPTIPGPPPPTFRYPLAPFLDPSSALPSSLTLPPDLARRHARVFNVVDPADPAAAAICFTSQYGKCLKASGSLLPNPDGSLRRFSPAEILRLLGFSSPFHLPSGLRLDKAWKLVANSVDVRCIAHLLRHLFSSNRT
ncbi:MAG TPA: DNA cytosine methyltransferase [Verrucomicrobiales bacterium]|nr:DNA cytosine methyltransferase [Verrucomicrobiales bacterium]